MYNDFKVANYSKALLSPELYARHLSRLFAGDVADGLTVTPGTGLQVVLAPGNAMIRYGSANVASARLVSLVASFNLSIGTPDVSNPRIDLVVVYIDNAVSLPAGTPTSANLDGLGVAKAKIVPGTPGSSPVAANSTAIQSSVGAGNPYTVVAQVRVDVGVSVIASNKITDVRSITKVTSDKIDYTTVPRFKAFRNGALTSTASNNTSIVFDTEIYDVGNCFDTSTGLFTAPFNCTMFFYTRVFCETAARAFITPRGTGAPTERSSDLQMTGIRRIDGSFNVPLTAGQTFGIQVWLDVAVSLASADTQLSGFMVARN